MRDYLIGLPVQAVWAGIILAARTFLPDPWRSFGTITAALLYPLAMITVMRASGHPPTEDWVIHMRSQNEGSDGG